MTSALLSPLPVISRWLTAVKCASAFLLLMPYGIDAAVLWSDSGATLVHETGPGKDILDGAVKRDDAASDTLYFKFRVSPLSDETTEEYFAAFELYEGDVEKLAIGNALRAWGYSAFLGGGQAADPKQSSG